MEIRNSNHAGPIGFYRLLRVWSEERRGHKHSLHYVFLLGEEPLGWPEFSTRLPQSVALLLGGSEPGLTDKPGGGAGHPFIPSLPMTGVSADTIHKSLRVYHK